MLHENHIVSRVLSLGSIAFSLISWLLCKMSDSSHEPHFDNHEGPPTSHKFKLVGSFEVLLDLPEDKFVLIRLSQSTNLQLPLQAKNTAISVAVA